jgi:quercetin dioxygenase-like cupin family protein
VTDAEPTHTLIKDLEAVLDIPDEGTLSRVLYRDDTIRVVGFAFDAGQELTEHTAALPAVLQVVKGRLRVTAGETTTELRSAGWLHMSAHLPHSVEALEPSVMLLTLLRT